LCSSTRVEGLQRRFPGARRGGPAGSEVCTRIAEAHEGLDAAAAAALGAEGATELWAPLLEETDFFDKYDAYLAVNILGEEAAAFDAFKGFMASRLRKLVERLGRPSRA